MTGIIGSGFGLYGYLPAVLIREEQVFLLERAKEKFYARNELLQYQSKVVWLAKEEDLLGEANTIILSVPPLEQQRIVTKILVSCSFRNIILEKPVACTPVLSDGLIEQLRGAGFNFRISFSFIFLKWFDTLQRLYELRRDQIIRITIAWKFKAHHFQNGIVNWKRFHEEGGGVIRFFGIHLIAVAALLQFEMVRHSSVKTFNCAAYYQWSGVASNTCGACFDIDVDTCSSKDEFRVIVELQKETVVVCDLSSPFDELLGSNSKEDKRVKIQGKLIDDLKKGRVDNSLYQSYIHINNLWSSFEEKVQVCKT